MLIDCDRCTARGSACSGCPVHALFETPDGITGLEPAELRAIEMFETAGFDVELIETPPVPVPLRPVRLVPARRRHVA
jgi:hypothetical protein